MGSLDYPSPVVVGDRMFYLNGSGQMIVFAVGDELKQIAVNRVTADKEIFWGSPAISDNRMVLRSAKYLYCVADKGESVKPAENPKAEEEESAPEGGNGGRAGGGRPRGGPGGGQGGGGRRFDPQAMFERLDTDKDEKLTAEELEGNPMADRLMTLDKDEDSAVSKEEFQGVTTLFSRGGQGGRGSRGGGGGGYGGGGEDKRPDRPQRPESAGN